MTEKKTVKMKVALNLRIPDELKRSLDEAVIEYNLKFREFPITRNDLATVLLKQGIENWAGRSAGKASGLRRGT